MSQPSQRWRGSHISIEKPDDVPQSSRIGGRRAPTLAPSGERAPEVRGRVRGSPSQQSARPGSCCATGDAVGQFVPPFHIFRLTTSRTCDSLR